MMIYFYILILITGVLSIRTDLTQKKIKNKDLSIVIAIALGLYCVLFYTGQLTFTPILILNPLVGLILGFVLYSSKLWKAGDAKLFFTYSLILPVNKYSSILPLSCLALFMNTFLIALIFVLPMFFKNIIRNKKEIIKEVISKKTLVYLGKIFLVTLAISWIIRPILNLLPLKNNIFLSFTLLYIGYLSIYRSLNKIKSKSLLILIFAIGLALRYLLMPESLSVKYLLIYLKFIITFSIIFYTLRTVMEFEDKKPQRIPFAPFMFLGAILINTNFLQWLLDLFKKITQ